MRRTVLELAVAVAAGLIVLAVTMATDSVKGTYRWLVVVAAFVAAFVLTWWLARTRSDDPTAAGATIGSHLKTRGRVNVDDVDVAGTDSTTVGSNIRTEGDVSIRDIRVRRENNHQ